LPSSLTIASQRWLSITVPIVGQPRLNGNQSNGGFGSK
jgi:hypothetical protein